MRKQEDFTNYRLYGCTRMNKDIASMTEVESEEPDNLN